MGMIVIHAGMHKTGTSSLQASLSSGLTDERYMYFDLQEINHSGSMVNLFHNKPEHYHGNRKRGRSSEEIKLIQARQTELLNNQLESLGSKTGIISAEDLCRFMPIELEHLRDYIHKYGHNYSIILYVRPPRPYIESAFQQVIKGGLNCFDLRKAYPVYTRLTSFPKVFGIDKCTFRIFSRNNLVRGDIVDDFLSLLSPSLGVNKRVFVNEAISLTALKFLYCYRKYGPGYGADKDAIRLNNTLVVRLSRLEGPKLRLSNQLTDGYFADCQDDVKALEQIFPNTSYHQIVNQVNSRDPNVRSENDLLSFSDYEISSFISLLQSFGFTAPIPKHEFYDYHSLSTIIAKLIPHNGAMSAGHHRNIEHESGSLYCQKVSFIAKDQTRLDQAQNENEDLGNKNPESLQMNTIASNISSINDSDYINIVLLGGSNSIMRTGIQSGLLANPRIHLTNLAIGGSTSLQNIAALIANWNLCSSADLIITESNVNDMFACWNTGISYDRIRHVVHDLFELLHVCNPTVLSIIVAANINAYPEQVHDKRSQIKNQINLIHRESASIFKIPTLDLDDLLLSLPLEKQHALVPDPFHMKPLLMHEIGASIIEAICQIPKQNNDKSRLVVSNAKKGLEFIFMNQIFNSYELEFANKKSSLTSATLASSSDTMFFPENLNGYRILGISTWGYGAIEIGTKDGIIRKYINNGGLDILQFNEIIESLVISHGAYLKVINYKNIDNISNWVTERCLNQSWVKPEQSSPFIHGFLVQKPGIMTGVNINQIPKDSRRQDIAAIAIERFNTLVTFHAYDALFHKDKHLKYALPREHENALKAIISMVPLVRDQLDPKDISDVMRFCTCVASGDVELRKLLANASNSLRTKE